MKIYGVEFEITEGCIDKSKVEASPGEGAIIPILLDRVPGLYNYLIRNRCIRKDKVDMIYIFSDMSCGGIVCVKYLNGVSAVIQDVGIVDFSRKYII